MYALCFFFVERGWPLITSPYCLHILLSYSSFHIFYRKYCSVWVLLVLEFLFT